MTEIIIKCDNCESELEVSDKYIHNMGSIVIVVKPCTDTNCYDCSDCEDAKALKALIEKFNALKEKLKGLVE